MTPLPDGDHEDYIELIVNQVYGRSRTPMQFSGNKGLMLTSGGGRPRDHVIPDGTFAPRELRLFRGADSWMPCHGVAMVLEVTSTKPRNDRETRRRCHARGGIPPYLLADRDASSVALFSDPEDDDYRRHCTLPFGKPPALPEPFAFELETKGFLWPPERPGRGPGTMVVTADEPGGRPRGGSLDLPEERPGSTGQGGG